MKLKICGVKSIEEARQLRDAGVDLVGLNFIPSSRRYITLETAQAIMAELQGSSIQTVALFAGKPVAEVNDYATQLRVNFVQLHGDEPAEYAAAVNATVIRAIAVDPNQSTGELLDFIDKFPADYFVLDRHTQGQGDPVNTEQASQIIAANPGKIFLAGGLNPDNLPEIIRQMQPYGIDIAGGVRNEHDNLDIGKVLQSVAVIHHRI